MATSGATASSGPTATLDGFRQATAEAIAQGKEKTANGAEVAGETLRSAVEVDFASEGLTEDWELSKTKAQQDLEESDSKMARFFGPESTMIGVLTVAVVLYLMPVILSKVGNAGGNISGPLGNINSGEQAAGVIEFGWLVPLLMIVFMVFAYLNRA
ncbi:hypothetical protein [Halorussus pelagicus]|uniref:hypothetical protein n=1 Tax=Halorussus pelagicus TaxID=2505977 RepID=UPI000FFB5B3A|nr:hypothetical protein [Halorussus pelagicus]